MRKVFYVFMILGLFFLQGCNEEVTPPVVCGTNEENVDGVCESIFEPEEIALINALANIDEMSSYQMDIAIVNGSEVYDIIIRFDDEKSSFEFDGQTEYYENQGGTNYHYIPQGTRYVKETLNETNNDAYDFFKTFKFEWFTYENGKYLMKTQYQIETQIFFEQAFPDCDLLGFEMTVESDYLAEMIFIIQIEEVSYHFTIEFSNIGTIDIVLPTV